MKVLKSMCVIFLALSSLAFGLLLLLQADKDRSYVDIYGSNEAEY